MSTEEEYDRLLKEFAHKVRTSITLRQSFERLIKAGMKTGRTDMQIGDDIRNELRGELSDRTIRRYLPESFKHMEKRNISIDHADRVRISSEAEPEPEKEFIVEKVDEYIAAVPDVPIETEIILDCNKFRSELRIGLTNSAKLKLYVRNNQVSKIL